ncbi:hypothetical protein AB4188_24455 [Vibrio lentus]|nr:hypothetical protein [Vibrio lentus]PMJ87391.1 hypothetical protein BCU14_25395 [Vibrio lentus]
MSTFSLSLKYAIEIKLEKITIRNQYIKINGVDSNCLDKDNPLLVDQPIADIAACGPLGEQEFGQ